MSGGFLRPVLNHDYACHQCMRLITFEEIAHCDLYSDVCWIQCDQCASATGKRCGVDRSVNPHPHGYFACPYRLRVARDPHYPHAGVARLLPARKPDGAEGA